MCINMDYKEDKVCTVCNDGGYHASSNALAPVVSCKWKDKSGISGFILIGYDLPWSGDSA